MTTTEPRVRTVAEARADLYELLAATFDGEMDVLVAAIETGIFVDVAATLPVDIDASSLEDGTVDREKLAITYDNLFVVPGPRYVPPFASAHTTAPSESFESDSPFHDEGEAGELLGDPAATMSRLYARAGVSPDPGDFPDHVATQVAFLAALERANARPGEERGEALQELWQGTVSNLSWLDSFHRSIERVDDTGVFTALAGILRTVIADTCNN
ncbi:putative component of anaerobic dehydrogenase [Halalkaliarchaeum sp. AArc-CO]|uniref:TorD/DmsD family molecular chaperone n=1 Tax=unclassified Halalkaliarchaeum TaxID=2678344 RepID=UPI00217CECF3|nr:MULTISPECIES: molecular chaperone TorD family protein [unclassified Halalkaliarchaeum]MDR5672620.1 molecular chaperone TorD family protein [Halalkaliarchaeum sp. AArc-GB]UWG50425.1 putative component of anaerobic dehydrogenase [Halalkaliarchaeum sp. AArc-CO]